MLDLHATHPNAYQNGTAHKWLSFERKLITDFLLHTMGLIIYHNSFRMEAQAIVFFTCVAVVVSMFIFRLKWLGRKHTGRSIALQAILAKRQYKTKNDPMGSLWCLLEKCEVCVQNLCVRKHTPSLLFNYFADAMVESHSRLACEPGGVFRLKTTFWSNIVETEVGSRKRKSYRDASLRFVRYGSHLLASGASGCADNLRNGEGNQT